MNKLYSVHDHWTDIGKKNDVDIESIDGVIAGIKVNGEDYGGSMTWESVYSDTIDPEGEVPPYSVDISLTMTASDTIKVIYDNTEYILPKQVFNEKIYYGATPAALPADIDFSNCPFLIQVLPDTIRVYTETAGLHSLDISQPQSGGGGSDFSTAEVTVINDTGYPTNINSPIIKRNMLFPDSIDMTGSDTLTMVLYKGIVYAEITSEGTISVSGNISMVESNIYAITGDCTITIS